MTQALVTAFPQLDWDAQAAFSRLAKRLQSDPRVSHDSRWLAYILATVYHETAGKFEPVEEAFWLKGPARLKHLQTKKYWPFYGRGFAQLTWEANYRKFGKRLGIPLAEQPSLAGEWDTAYEILIAGLVDALFIYERPWPGRGLRKYIRDGQCDYSGARALVNGKDRAEKIAREAGIFERILKEEIL